ncbi:response regulator transcription factor [Actinocrispum wychmicini]|uniref:DNA-binding response OmpR family regulator n=1 Tax=Actinocrispum wychmicini TaxID=1213861 RepID=A0A4R2J476_9PSEU|nr:response regulator transcription factor [Actinocrispum wychmicini]TCO53471.1 DNA-binding response OmpR family regulator [Actinocrispum wychmicini]
MRVLLVEDDDGVGDALTEALAARGHVPTRVTRGADALTRHQGVDVVLLDLGLPDHDGMDVLRMLKAIADVPILVLTARGDERSVVRGLKIGADDYMVKPVRLAELLARMDTITRRAAQAQEEHHTRVVRVSDVEIDLGARRVTAGDRVVPLTTMEFNLLAVLAGQAGTAVSRQTLMFEVWGNVGVGLSRALDVHVASLRGKLDRPGLLTTIRGFGYRLDG